MQPTIGLAFLAGLLSFISPCVLPLVPAYIGYMGGRLTHTVAARSAVGAQALPTQTVAHRFVTLLHGVAFVAGFTFIFVVLGLLTTAFVVQVGRQNLSLIEHLIARIGGIVIIFFGLHFMGVLPSLFNRLLANKPLISSPLPAIVLAVGGVVLIAWALVDLLLALPVIAVFLLWLVLGGAFTAPEAFWTRTITTLQRALYSQVRMQMTASGHQNFASSALMGVVFAAGWTPCIGPVYGAVLTMAANGGSVSEAGTLLGAYSLGLGIPFLLTALLLDSAQSTLRRVQRHMHTVELVTGGFLVVIGVLIASGQLQRLSNTFAGQFTDVSIRVEECGLGVAQGQLEVGQLVPCLNGEQEPASLAAAQTTAEPIADTATPEPAESASVPALGSITGLAAAASDSPTYGVERGNLALNFHITTDDGQEHDLADLRGKVVLVNFWATWCGPCRTEMPIFEQAYGVHGDDNFVVLAVNNRETLDEIAGFREEVQVTFPMALDPNGEIQTLYGIEQYPVTLVIDPDGVIVTRHVGPLTADQIESLVSSALA